MLWGVEIHAATPDRLDDLADLFESGFGDPRLLVHVVQQHGQRGAGGVERRREPSRLEELAGRADPPLGLIAYEDDIPIGWLATGPRSRYQRAIGPRARLLKDRDPSRTTTSGCCRASSFGSATAGRE